MRKMLFGVAAAVLMVGIVALSAVPVSAGITKTCWSHEDTDEFLADGVTPNPDFGQLVAVWANGGGHTKHTGDINLGLTDTYAACVALQ
ncbi:MAG TPA: hypothetical protein VES67_24590 [Vicinamibacterales bacterium]|nr:hypothetical protein [Vicinamibacterales bacterium]